MTISEKGKELIKKYEGCSLVAYACSSGVATIGFGHTTGVKLGTRISQELADYYFDCDVQRFAEYVNLNIVKKIDYELTQEQFDVLVSFTYNLGSIRDGFKYALLKGDLKDAVARMTQYTKSGGKHILGLQRRRMEEAVMFTGYPIAEEDLKTIRKASRLWLNQLLVRLFAWYEEQ